jgi:hypothetical protein
MKEAEEDFEKRTTNLHRSADVPGTIFALSFVLLCILGYVFAAKIVHVLGF